MEHEDETPYLYRGEEPATPHPPLPLIHSTLDIPTPRPHAPPLDNPTLLKSTDMTTRSADDAGLSDSDSDKTNTRVRTEGPPEVDNQPAENDNFQPKDLDILTYIPHPPINLLQIHGWDNALALENVDPAQATIWTEASDAKVLCYKAYGGKIEDRDDIIELREMIKESLSLTANPTIATPSPERTSTKKDTPPYCTLIRGIHPEKIQELITRVSNRRQAATHTLTDQTALHLHRKDHGTIHPLRTPPIHVRHHHQGIHLS